MKKKLLVLFISSLSLTTLKAQVVDFTFENPFTTGFGNANPAGWASVTSLTPGTCVQDSMHHSGNFSAKITTKNCGLSALSGGLVPDVSGIMLTGAINPLNQNHPVATGYPFTSREDSLGFYAKYSPMGTDSAFVSVVMTKFNTATNKRDTIGFGMEKIGSNTNFELKYCIINYNTALSPDTAIIVVSSSQLVGAQLGSMLWVDDFAWGLNTVGIKKQAKDVNVSVYPMPANNDFTINYSTLKDVNSVEIIDLSGRTIQTFKANNQIENYSTQNINSGLYIYQVRDSKYNLLAKGKLSIVK
jgi:hypothetical protein